MHLAFESLRIHVVRRRIKVDGNMGATFARFPLNKKEREPSFVEIFAWFLEFDHGLLQIRQRTLHQDLARHVGKYGSLIPNLVVFEVDQQVVPQRLPRKNLRIAKHGHPKLSASESDVQPTRIIQETNTCSRYDMQPRK